MAADSTTMLGALKYVYGGLISSLQNLEPTMWDKLGTAPEKPRGRGFVFGVHLSGNMAGGPTSEYAPLRAAQAERVAQATVNVKEYEHSIEITNLIKALSKGDPAAFVQVADHAVREAAKSMRKYLSQDLYRDGTGTISLVNGAVSAATTITVDQSNLFRKNMVLDGWNAAGSTKQFDSVQISYVDNPNNQIELASAVTIEDNGLLKIEDVTSTMSIDGLARMVDTTTTGTSYLGISRSTELNWRGNVLSGGSNAISGDLMQQGLDRVLTECGKQPTFILSNPIQRRQYLNLATPQRRFMDGKFDVGFNVLEFNGMPWNIDVDCQRDRVWILELDDIQKFILQDVEINGDGGGMFKPVPGYRKSWAYYEFIGNAACRQPNHHLQINTLAQATY